MLISYNWQRELTGTGLDPQEMRERLTNVGLTVDSVEERDGDFVLDVEVPSNRGDCLSHLGIAREIAVIEKSKVQSPKSKVENLKGKAGDFASVEIGDPDLCPRYAARVVRGVKIAPSPDWLVKRLEVLGQRPINNVADITNYVLHEFGQPLHAFDLAKLGQQRIVVRRAAKGEAIKTLDGVERKLDPDMLVIADATRPVAVAGVMGGADSEISSTTEDVLIESAWFDPASVRRTAKLLGLHTEASHRFERGVDPERVLSAQARCIALICEIAGGVATEDEIDAYPKPFPARTAELRPERVATITSLQVPRAEMLRILTSLGFELREDDSAGLAFTIPSWRHDVAIEEDLVEEVARHTGFDQIKTDLPPASLAGEYHSSERRRRALRKAMSTRGFDEAICLSFTELTEEIELIPELAGRAPAPVVLTNPIIEEASRMRQTLLPGLLNSIRRNLNHGNRDVTLFETGRVFGVDQPGQLPLEREAFALVATGGALEANRAQAERELDFFDLKGALESAVEAMNLPPLDFEKAEVKHLRPGQSAAISLKGRRVGSIGRLSESLAGAHKFRQPVFLAEVDLTTLLEGEELPVLYSPLPRFPSIVRDLSLLVDRKVTVAELLRAAQDQEVEHFIEAGFVGAYEGKGIPDGKRSVTLRIEYRADDRTLRDEEVDHIHSALVAFLVLTLPAEVR
ncbi:MAG: phenylalanyl-tRNA synthetase beta chain [Blastocatellia bacterium]|jgi:phenylalanyl-tRNA synthetase beta chain|nr:phenylalanyl-tRNA synthetase beta chain [Blastocatellia bacterium]